MLRSTKKIEKFSKNLFSSKSIANDLKRVENTFGVEKSHFDFLKNFDFSDVFLLENDNFEGYQLFHFSICAETSHRFGECPMSSSVSAARVEELVFVFNLWDFEIDKNCNLSSQRGFSAIFSLDFRCHFRTNLEAVCGFANHMLMSETD